MTQAAVQIRLGRLLAVALVTLAATLLGFAVASTAAQAQDLPAYCNEYSNAPNCDAGSPEATGDTGPSSNDGANVATGTTTGTLPFTGYPMTGLVLLLVVLLLVGLALRAYVAVHDRLSSGSRS